MSTPADKARFDALIAAAVDGIMVIDAGGIVQEYSPACERLFGYVAAEVVGRNIKMLMPSPYHEQHDGYLSNYRATAQKRIIGIGREVIGRRKDNTTFPMYLSVGEGRLGNESIFVGIVHDMTTQQSSERRLRELQAELLHVSRLSEIGQMASALAHELNQPLTAIVNYTKAGQALLEEAGSAETTAARDAMGSVADQAVRAGEIIRRIREFVSRGDTEKSEEQIGTIIDDTLTLASVANRLGGIKIRRNVAAGTKVLVDKIQIQQVLLNLVRNAAEAMEDQTDAELSVTAISTPDFVEVKVCDNGPGLASEVSERLFEPFVSTKEKGMGVGLSICRAIVESHGGRLWASSNEGRGVTFSLTLAKVGTHDDSAVT
jgi:two-component system sensor kinase FixL